MVLNGISCFSANRCQAVGATENDGFPVTPLAFAWNGHGWQPSPAPNIRGNHRGGLDAVSCPSPSICLGVGYSMQSESSFGSETLADMWISQHWDLQLMPSSDPDLLDSLQAISCTSPTWCVAVGDAFDGGGDFATVAESFS